MGVALSLAACARRAPEPERVAGSTAAVGPAVSLERTPCFGRCPVYAVSVSPTGLVTYHGTADVRLVGTDTARIPQKQVDALLRDMERAGYFTFDSRYAMSEPGCGRYSTDSPSAITSATFRGRTKRVEHDYGCMGAPGALTLLETKIDEVLGSVRWTGR